MKPVVNLSIKWKTGILIILVTVISLGLATAFAVYTKVTTSRSHMVNEFRTIAKVIGEYSVSDLVFKDPIESKKTLAHVKSVPAIDYVHIFDENDQSFSFFHRDEGADALEVQLVKDHYYFDDGALHIFEPINYRNVVYGTLYLRVSTEGLQKKIQAYLKNMILLILALIFLSGCLAWWFQGLITKPILLLAGVTKKVKETSDYGIRVPETETEEELAVLYSGFNAMLAQIEESTLAIKEKQEELDRYAGELERSNRELDQFAYVTSHDLKAPLRAISNLSQWIEEDLEEVLNEDNRKQMELLRGRVSRMEGLINGILEYSRIGRIHNKLDVVDLNTLLDQIKEMLDPPEGFEINVHHDLPTLETERYRIQQVFANLISNAIKYVNRPDGIVDITMEEESEFYFFHVKDNGPGISEEFHQKIFVIFQTLQSRDKFESTGVGLSIVKKIVEDKGGTIEVASTEGEGSVFSFSWPKIDPIAKLSD